MIEDEIRTVLMERAGDAPAGAAMLTSVGRGTVRRTRQRVVVLAAAAAVVLIGAGSAVALGDDGGQPAQIAAPGAATPDDVVFPYRATVRLGSASPAEIEVHQRRSGLLFVDRSDGSQMLVGEITLSAQEPRAERTKSPVTIRGKRGWSVPSGDSSGPGLVWEAAPDEWLSLTTDLGAELTVDQLVACAEGIVREPTRRRVPYSFDTMPAGYELWELLGTLVEFAPQSPSNPTATSVPSAGAEPGKAAWEPWLITVYTVPGDAEDTIDGWEDIAKIRRQVKVGGRPAWIAVHAGKVSVAVDLGDKYLVVQTPAKVLTEQETLDFAAGVRLR